MTWALVDNPAWAGKTPGDGTLEPACHDKSHFVTIACTCGEQMHIHESQLAGHDFDDIGAPCKGCGELLLFPPGVLPGAFATMRRQGWIT
jgi:hypothetical protein